MNEKNRIILPLSVFLIALMASLGLTGYFQNKGPKEIEEESHPMPEIFSWQFEDSRGKSVRLTDLPQGYKILFFGSLDGSEVTPQALTTLERISQEKFRYPLIPVFISLDPDRDSLLLIHSTLQGKNSSILGLRAEKEIASKMATRYGVRFEITALPTSKMGTTVDQSPWMYLTTPDFRILGAYPTQIRFERLKMEVDTHMKRKPPKDLTVLP